MSTDETETSPLETETLASPAKMKQRRDIRKSRDVTEMLKYTL